MRVRRVIPLRHGRYGTWCPGRPQRRPAADPGRALAPRRASGDIPGTCIAVGLRHARALLAQDAQEAAGRFDEALGADLTTWPLSVPGCCLHTASGYGASVESRNLAAAAGRPRRLRRDGLRSLGDQARRELRASGESSRRRDLAASDQLTAQELQIAQLAAQGLSNRDIGQRLSLSHRTIGTHLYRIFPKLGITSCGELRSALSARTALREVGDRNAPHPGTRGPHRDLS
jgi:DNA-binding CsgD family transcriptional regulator